MLAVYNLFLMFVFFKHGSWLISYDVVIFL